MGLSNHQVNGDFLKLSDLTILRCNDCAGGNLGV